MAVQNYVTLVYRFGDWPEGTVLPEFAVLWSGGTIEEMVERGWIAPTGEVPSAATIARLSALADEKKLKAAPAPAVPEAAQLELAKLADALAAADDAHAAMQARAEAAEAKADAVTAEIANYLATNAHLSRAAEEHQAALALAEKDRDQFKAEAQRLAAEMDELTRPAAPAAGPAPAG